MVNQATQYTIKKVPLKEIENLKTFWLYNGPVEDAIKCYEEKYKRPASKVYVIPDGTAYIPVEREE